MFYFLQSAQFEKSQKEMAETLKMEWSQICTDLMLIHFHSNFFKWNTVYDKGQVYSFHLVQLQLSILR